MEEERPKWQLCGFSDSTWNQDTNTLFCHWMPFRDITTAVTVHFGCVTTDLVGSVWLVMAVFVDVSKIG